MLFVFGLIVWVLYIKFVYVVISMLNIYIVDLDVLVGVFKLIDFDLVELFGINKFE